jgi:hypothetical protein
MRPIATAIGMLAQRRFATPRAPKAPRTANDTEAIFRRRL